MLNTVNLNTNSNPKPETAGTLAVNSTPPSIFSTETAGSIASNSTNTTSGSFSAMA